MLFSALSAYIHGLLIHKYNKKVFLFTGVTINFSLLLFFKYTDFFIQNINNFLKTDIKLLKLALPLGISFYTFQTVSYMIDVYRKDTIAQKNPIKLFLYVTFFPQLIAGPIVRYTDIEKELSYRTHSLSMISKGITRFVIGLGKKILIANVLGELCGIFRKSDEKSILFTGYLPSATCCRYTSTFRLQRHGNRTWAVFGFISRLQLSFHVKNHNQFCADGT